MFSKKKLWNAIENGQLIEGLALIKEAGDINSIYTGIENELGQTFLIQALNRGQVDIALALLDAGADASICDFRGNSPLYYFVKSGLYEHTFLAERLINRGADLNKRIGGYSFLSLAFLKMKSLVSFLLKQKIDVTEAPYIDNGIYLDLFFPIDVVAYRDMPYLSLAIINNDTESFDYLLRFSETINSVDAYGRTPLMIAALLSDIHKAQKLIDGGAFLDVKDFAGRSVQDYFKNMAERKYQDMLAIQGVQNNIVNLISLVEKSKNLSKEREEIEQTEIKIEKVSIWSKIKLFFGFKG